MPGLRRAIFWTLALLAVAALAAPKLMTAGADRGRDRSGAGAGPGGGGGGGQVAAARRSASTWSRPSLWRRR